MISSAVASRYANALVDVVTGPATPVQPQQALGELQAFGAVLAESAELRNALSSPSVPTARKRAVVGAIAAKLDISKVTRNFLFILIDKRRLDGFTHIAERFDVLLDERLGFARAEITSARPLDPGQQSALVAELARLSGRQLRPRFAVDDKLIGGVIARIGSTVYDGSVQGQLRLLGERLHAE